MNGFQPDEESGKFKKFGVIFGIIGVLAIVALVFGKQFMPKKSDNHVKREPPPLVMIKPLPPPPAMTPPPTPPPETREEKMVAQEPVNPDEEKPEDPKPAAPDVGTNVQGNGSDAFGLSGKGSGFSVGGNGTGRKASRFGWYAAQVQRQVSDALQKNRRTRSAAFRVEARIWPDSTGRVTRASVVGTGDSELDEAIRNEILTGMQLQEPPPAGMPTPIVLRLTARRP